MASSDHQGAARVGRLRRQRGRIVTDPRYWPPLWVKKNGVVVTVAGDLTVDEMVRVAGSLHPWGE